MRIVRVAETEIVIKDRSARFEDPRRLAAEVARHCRLKDRTQDGEQQHQIESFVRVGQGLGIPAGEGQPRVRLLRRRDPLGKQIDAVKQVGLGTPFHQVGQLRAAPAADIEDSPAC